MLTCSLSLCQRFLSTLSLSLSFFLSLSLSLCVVYIHQKIITRVCILMFIYIANFNNIIRYENPLETNRFVCVRSYMWQKNLMQKYGLDFDISVLITNLDCWIIENIKTELSKILIDIIQSIRKMSGHLNNFWTGKDNWIKFGGYLWHQKDYTLT